MARRHPGRRQSVLPLAASLREAELIDTAERLERAYDREARIVALDVPDREAILRVLEECPEELLELRATLLQERVWLQREGLASRAFPALRNPSYFQLECPALAARDQSRAKEHGPQVHASNRSAGKRAPEWPHRLDRVLCGVSLGGPAMSALPEGVDVERPAAGVAVVAFTGEHDLATRDVMSALLASLVEDNGAVILDFSNAEFVDSSILVVVEEANRKARERGTIFGLQLGTAPHRRDGLFRAKRSIGRSGVCVDAGGSTRGYGRVNWEPTGNDIRRSCRKWGNRRTSFDLDNGL